VVARIAPLLRSGGLIFASSPNISHHRVIRSLLRGSWDLADQGVMDRTHLRWFTPRSYQAMFENAGFIIEERRPIRLDRVPQDLVHAVLAAEDERFFRHLGISMRGVARAAWVAPRRSSGRGSRALFLQGSHPLHRAGLRPRRTHPRLPPCWRLCLPPRRPGRLSRMAHRPLGDAGRAGAAAFPGKRSDGPLRRSRGKGPRFLGAEQPQRRGGHRRNADECAGFDAVEPVFANCSRQ
ncbi:MAG: transglycosylase domain-containing protein, partial [Rhodobacteraceae bacterium]|nr:transglycosylase domain-containing protein [Paracoccaceae bacterium]